MEQTTSFDLTIIGSGPAGYRAAVQSARLGKRVAIVECRPQRLGGTWIHTGTIPSKTMRESIAAIRNIAYHAGSGWVDRIVDELSTERLIARTKQVSQFEENIVRRYLTRYGIEIIEGRGSLEDGRHVRIALNSGETKVVGTQHILVSSGSSPRRPESIPFDGWRVVDADEILRIDSLPKSMLIYGAGVIGCEYACIFANLGCEVTLIDSRNVIMQHLDQEVALELKKSMASSGVKYALGNGLSKVKTDGPRVTAILDNGDGLEAEMLFFAAGRIPNTSHIGLERLEIKTSSRGHIEVNENFQTSVPNIYAAGDVIGAPALAATAASQGRHAALHMYGRRCKPFPKNFPLGVYTIPELSTVGATEEELRRAGSEFVIGRAHYSEVARGFIRGDEHGLVKLLVCSKTHRILGLHIVGHDACNLIHIGVAFMQRDGCAQEFIDMVFNYPTLAEAYRIAAFNALNKLFPDGEILDPPEVGEGEDSPVRKLA